MDWFQNFIDEANQDLAARFENTKRRLEREYETDIPPMDNAIQNITAELPISISPMVIHNMVRVLRTGSLDVACGELNKFLRESVIPAVVGHCLNAGIVPQTLEAKEDQNAEYEREIALLQLQFIEDNIVNLQTQIDLLFRRDEDNFIHGEVLTFQNATRAMLRWVGDQLKKNMERTQRHGEEKETEENGEKNEGGSDGGISEQG